MKLSNKEATSSEVEGLILVKNILQTIKIHRCCSLWTVVIPDLAVREKAFLTDFMPGALAAIVAGHHVVTKDEWRWYATANGRERCDADDHTKDTCLHIKEALESYCFPAKIVPYPNESGLQFRFVAQAAGAGEIGKNAFLLHPQWGLWIHLRVLITKAPTEAKPTNIISVCNACDACISACLAGAIQDKSFDGLRCRSYHKAKGEYIPAELTGELRWCKTCADICPIGQEPEETK
jgi:epoxyqueuosine reductase